MAKILVTSALPYINGVKHLGNLVGSMLPADVYARFMRQTGNEVLYICATDEHGTPAELGALEENKPVEQFCAEKHELQKGIYEEYKMSFDYFGRTSSVQNTELTQYFAKKLLDNGHIETREIKQVYSVDDGRFLPDRYVTGTCPYCGYESARGDQCEQCTKLLDPAELINPRSSVSGSTNLEIRESNHLFLKLPELEETVKTWLDTKYDWPGVVTGIANKWLKEGLKERCITRDLKWGVPVPFEGLEGKVFYVWFDAPIGYISATKEWADEAPESRDWKSWWTEGNDVKYVQFMAKDNIPFHTIMFPATILGANDGWKNVDYIKGFNWLTFYGGKFSTSQKRGVFTDQALKEFSADYWRYWLMANAPETNDSSFTFSGFAAMINKDLNGILGNYVNRVLKMTESKIGAFVPEGGEEGEAEKALYANLETYLANYKKYMEEMEFRKAMNELRAIWVEGNNFLTVAEPWSVIKTDVARASAILRVAINLIRVLAIASWSIIPDASAKMFELLNLDASEQPKWFEKSIVEELKTLKAGHKFNSPELLFEKIEQDRIDTLIQTYGGEE